jgi:hypothetical protein
MAKRGAALQLTDRNWDQEEESEEVLNFVYLFIVVETCCLSALFNTDE